MMNYCSQLISKSIVLILLTTCVSVYAEEEDDHQNDYRTFHTDGQITYGQIGDSYTSDLVLYLAGNQFMVIPDLISAFLHNNTDIDSVYVETIPPGEIVNSQLLKQGDVNGRKTAINPDLYASVNLAHLQKLKQSGIMDNYIVYIHNKLELMVRQGNPKNVNGPEDLARDDLVKSLPNPLTEGIFRFYGQKMLKQLKILDQVTDNKQCMSCWAVDEKTWFTERHHRETPSRIEQGLADIGLVWASEVKYADAQGRQTDGIPIPAPYNMADAVNYAIGILKEGRNIYNAVRFLSYLGTQEAQDIYEKHGFVKAGADDLRLKPIP